MFKIIKLIYIVVMVSFLSSCGNKILKKESPDEFFTKTNLPLNKNVNFKDALPKPQDDSQDSNKIQDKQLSKGEQDIINKTSSFKTDNKIKSKIKKDKTRLGIIFS